jgi:hypothetical protein
MGDYVRRFKGRLRKAEGMLAAAHKLARILWSLIVSGQPYDEAKAFALTPASTARRLKNLQNQAKALNMTLVPAYQLRPSVIREARRSLELVLHA